MVGGTPRAFNKEVALTKQRVSIARISFSMSLTEISVEPPEQGVLCPSLVLPVMRIYWYMVDHTGIHARTQRLGDSGVGLGRGWSRAVCRPILLSGGRLGSVCRLISPRDRLRGRRERRARPRRGIGDGFRLRFLIFRRGLQSRFPRSYRHSSRGRLGRFHVVGP